ncbi:unnamed protein product [Ectocarpus sp. 12 AP-2014]
MHTSLHAYVRQSAPRPLCLPCFPSTARWRSRSRPGSRPRAHPDGPRRDRTACGGRAHRSAHVRPDSRERGGERDRRDHPGAHHRRGRGNRRAHVRSHSRGRRSQGGNGRAHTRAHRRARAGHAHGLSDRADRGDLRAVGAPPPYRPTPTVRTLSVPSTSAEERGTRDPPAAGTATTAWRWRAATPSAVPAATAALRTGGSAEDCTGKAPSAAGPTPVVPSARSGTTSAFPRMLPPDKDPFLLPSKRVVPVNSPARP